MIELSQEDIKERMQEEYGISLEGKQLKHFTTLLNSRVQMFIEDEINDVMMRK